MPTPYSPGGAARRPGGHLGAVVVVGDLDQDARAVAHQLVGATAPRWSRFEDLQAPDDAMPSGS